MKIVNIKAFMELPAGTLFCVYRTFGYEFLNLMVKDKNWTVEGPNNFFFQDLHEVHNDSREKVKILDKAVKEGTSFSFDLSEPGRIGPWDEDTLFAVYERADMLQLMERLRHAYSDSGMIKEGWDQFDELVESIPEQLEGFTAPVPDIEEHSAPVGHLTLGALIKSLPGYQDTQGNSIESELPVFVTKESMGLLEKAPKEPEMVIQPDENGYQLNYGRLVACNLDGLPFLTQLMYAKALELPYVVMNQLPEFVKNFQIELHDTGSQISIHALEKEDIAQLAVALSKKFPSFVVGVGQKARWLQSWHSGESQFPRRTLDYYYKDLTKEQIENSKF